MDMAASPTVFFIPSSNVSHGVWHHSMEIATHTDDATMSASWLAPLSASSGIYINTIIMSATSVMSGIADSHRGGSFFVSSMRISTSYYSSSINSKCW